MKTFTLSFRKYVAICSLLLITNLAFSQTSYVEVSVTWPAYSSENRVEIYDPIGTLISTIDNGYTGGTNNSYSTTVSLGCIADANNYYFIMYDTADDGWDGADNITITSAGTNVINQNGDSASSSGSAPVYFNVSGGCSGTCSSTPISSFPYNEGFESGLGAWTQDTGDNFNWSRLSGLTGSPNTGPDPGANGGSYYLYTEASGNYGNTANLESPCFDLTGAVTAQFSFYYHMYANQVPGMGDLFVEVSTNNGLSYPTILWSQIGRVQTSHTQAWNLVNIDLSAYLGQTIMIRFRGLTGPNYRSDICIDDISLTASTTPQPEINITGLTNTIFSGDATPISGDNTLYGSTGSGTPISHTFTIQNTGTLPLTVGAISFGGANPLDFSVSTFPAASIAAGSSSNFVVDFDPTANGTRSAIISIVNGDTTGGENPYTFTIQGTGVVPLTEGPGGVTSDLALWLKGTDGLSYTSGQSVSLWADQGRGADATVNTAGQEPTYYDSATQNVNFNPVVDFDNLSDEFENSFDYTEMPQQYLEGTSGYYTNDIFMVVIPNRTINSSFGSMDLFCSDHDTSTQENDGSGIGFGAYSQRFSGEVVCYAYAMSNGVDDGFGVSQNGGSHTYDNVGIINARHNNNTTATTQELHYNANNIVNNTSDIGAFGTISDEKYWIGRSEGWRGSTDARIAEIITYSARKDDANLTQERNRIQSYLAIKYGITLGTNGTSQDYVNSDGTVIWDVNTGTPAEDVFNHDIAGIGRDDASDLLQKQSRSVNNAIDVSEGTRGQGVLTMGISSIYDTNNLNPSTALEDKEFLIWGNDGVDLDNAPINVEINMSANITPAIPTRLGSHTDGSWVEFNGIPRTWKVVENVKNPLTDDIPTVEVAILENAVRTAAPPNGVYLMFISDTPNFDPTADYRIMTTDTNELGEAIVKTDYDFDGTKYITFGWAPEREYKRSIYFSGAPILPATTSDYIDMEDALDLNPSEFTVSAWIKRESGSENTSILSKRNTIYTTGYDLKVNLTGHIEMHWNGGSDLITSKTPIPVDQWHQVAIIYSGGTARLYIDGVFDEEETSMSNPTATNESFYIGAAGKGNPTAYFKGNIDEVRVWDRALSVDQLRLIMNQEIEQNSETIPKVRGTVLPNSITKNHINSIPWDDLIGYYPMSTYTYTNTKDESGKGNQGALRNLRTVDRQTAPLPYQTTQNGTSWDTAATWKNGSEQTIPGSASIVDTDITVDWNIINIGHDINMSNSTLPIANAENRTVLGLLIQDTSSYTDAVDPEKDEPAYSGTLTVDGVTDRTTSTFTGNGLTVTHYLDLDGDIDLEGESQLIQTIGSDLDVNSSGTLERDQQGTADTYTYNYWASPVGISNTLSNNNSYTLANVITNLSYNTSGYNGTAAPLTVADYWIWKFANQPNGEYSAWQHVRSTGSLYPGQGYTMKGPGSGSILTDQNYVFNGKPNNGNIGTNGDIKDLDLGPNSDYLVGNPYPSAIDAVQFILDNGPIINYDDPDHPETNPITDGTLYFWEHWGGGSHIYGEYQGGYATYNLSGGAPAAHQGTTHPDVATGGAPSKTPGRYIPVGQGFFVVGEGTGGKINFNNGQRVFQKEAASLSGSSVFLRSGSGNNSNQSATNSDNRPKIRIGFNSVNTLRRQLLLTIDNNATTDIDWGYDGKLNEEQTDDLYWLINGEKHIIQGSNEIGGQTVYPLGIKTNTSGLNTITIDALENVPNNLKILVHDIENNTYHNLRTSDFEFSLPAGEYLDKFEITFFEDDALSLEENELNNLEIYYSNEIESIVLLNPTNKDIKYLELFNIAGQSIATIDDISELDYSEYKVKNLSTGTYIIKIHTVSGSVSKKVLVK
ncbi:LamG-like jellyroll fold domain-containing protein [Ichthyenterobacterium magnum]|uniref:Putative secreted protein (Por secretion system target) n=1 Tax=Ichthyenterobacterium magnum TaxID=1230530 RepID=A0A420DL07_9FLAO|nr:LamG-like jellyroll fold domain-containing protein [Ichthyenterobacterium magnum]RKE94940.1 putative secreted protein (Por secretion system target) [Ichthyenterobacterium magnum]